jgi:hypothetical protein
MDFIERIFGISPDGGDGSTEVLIVSAVLAVIVVVFVAKMMRRRADSGRHA